MSNRISRRQALKIMGGAAAGLAAGSALRVGASGLPGMAARLGRAAYEGKIVVYSHQDAQRMTPLIEAVQAQFPGITLDWRGLTSERYVELFSAAELAGDQIDIMHLNGQDTRRYAVAGKLLDMSDIAYKDRFLPVSFDAYTIDGKLWGAPHGGIAGFAFLYNKKLLEKIGLTAEPETYADLLALKPELDELGAAVFTHQGKNIYLWPVWQFWAHAQTSGNKAVENTIKTLRGEMKFTDPEHVAALDILYRFAQDGMFSEDVLSLDTDSCQVAFFQGKALFWYWHISQITPYRQAEAGLTEIDMSVMPPVRAVDDASVMRQLPGNTGNPMSIYANIAPERLEVTQAIVDFMCTDEWVKWWNVENGEPVSCNKNVTANEDPIAVKYANDCAPLQFTYLDWTWPPEITRAFQEQQQAIVAGEANPEDAAQAIQDTMDELYADGYEFVG